MSRKRQLFLRLGGLVALGVALLGDLPDMWAMATGIIGAIMFFATGPT